MIDPTGHNACTSEEQAAGECSLQDGRPVSSPGDTSPAQTYPDVPYSLEEYPWDDSECGSEQGLTTEQVINLRDCVVTANMVKLPERQAQVS
jgi:hypothetical protein